MNRKKLLSLLMLTVFVSPLAACSGDSGKSTTLRVLNMEDYIYTHNPDDGYDEDDFTDQFEQYIADDPVLSGKYGKVNVIYDTTDTNETLYSEMQTGKAHYDLICPSDYMIQKLIMYDLIEELDWNEDAGDVAIPNYVEYGSHEIRARLNAIEATRFKDNQTLSLQKFAVGYMWGTLGILFNPDYKKFDSISETLYDMQDWATLWNSKYQGTISVKDSMRDTYAVGIMYTYQEELRTLLEQYNTGAITKEKYNEDLSIIFNRCEKEQVEEVKSSLMDLKGNIFGLEVDSGKQDIVTGKIGVNLAWSGDAVYSMDQAEDEKQVGSNIQTLTYSVPETGSNIWFDAWVMPKTSRTQDQRDLAHEFLNFMCNPFYAAKNMDYTGYTSFIGGDDILDLVRDWYDCRTDEMSVTYEDVDCDIYVTDNPQYEDDILLYDDFISTKHGLRHEDREDEETPLVPTISDTAPLYFFYDENENGEFDEGEMLPVKDEEGNPVLFGNITIVDDEAFDYVNFPADFGDNYDDEELCYEYIQEVDLTYFFSGTLSEHSAEDMIFYGRGNYLPYCYEDEEGIWHHNTSVGRQFFVQFPNDETMTRCAIMKDYGQNNQYVMKMWEDFRSNTLPTWALVLFVLEILLFTAGIAWWIYIKSIKKKLRKKRKEVAEVK